MELLLGQTVKTLEKKTLLFSNVADPNPDCGLSIDKYLKKITTWIQIIQKLQSGIEYTQRPKKSQSGFAAPVNVYTSVIQVLSELHKVLYKQLLAWLLQVWVLYIHIYREEEIDINV